MESDEMLYEGRFIHLKRRGSWEYAERPGITGIVLIVPLTEDGKLIINEQFRIPVGKSVIELPAGLVGDTEEGREESLEEAARRELEEETGFGGGTWHYLCEGPPSAGITNEILSFYLARGLKRVGTGGGDADEQIVVHTVALEDVPGWLAEMAAAGKLIDPKVYIGLYFAGLK